MTIAENIHLDGILDRTGGVQHASFDTSANAGAYIAGWVAEVLGGSLV